MTDSGGFPRHLSFHAHVAAGDFVGLDWEYVRKSRMVQVEKLLPGGARDEGTKSRSYLSV